MRKSRLLEAATKRCLLPDVSAAERAVDRFLGLMGKRELKPGSGLYLPRCSSIHTCFMLFPIDTVYLDGNKRVRKIVRALKPWRLSWCPGADSVLEAPAGWADEVGLSEGAQVVFEDEIEAVA